jgi:hypothetical protein
LEIGDWRLEIGDWRLEIGDWRLEIGDWREVVVRADERRWFGDGSWQMSNKRQRWRGEDG